MELLVVLLASLCFATGGLLMKASAGATKLWATLGFCALFLIGALLQAVAMRRADLGVVYIAVLGVEAALAFGLSVFLLRESASPTRVLAVVLIVAGVLLLRRS